MASAKIIDDKRVAPIGGPPPPGVAGGARRQDIELLRILGAFGVVWVHANGPGKDVAYAGLAVFLVISFYFGASGRGQASLAARARRLLVPWLGWCLVYAAFNLVKHQAAWSFHHGILAGILLGPYYHLWYLPFVFLVLVVFDRVRKIFASNTLAVGAAACGIILLATVAIWRPWMEATVAPAPFYAQALPGVLLGVFFGTCAALPFWQRLALLAGWFVAAATAWPVEGMGVNHLVALAVCAPVFLSSRDWLAGRSVALIARTTLGVYLIHPIIVSLAWRTGLFSQLVMPVVVFVVSVAAIMVFDFVGVRTGR